MTRMGELEKSMQAEMALRKPYSESAEGWKKKTEANPFRYELSGCNGWMDGCMHAWVNVNGWMGEMGEMDVDA